MLISPKRTPGAWTPPADSPQARALEHVAALSAGLPMDPTLHVTLNFHPDRTCNGLAILNALAEDGIYRSQFETGTSNGALSAHEGGSRWHWESRIFGGAYDGTPPADRPKYGAVNYRRRPTGGSPRFGSAHFRQKPEILLRSTFCYPDSFFEPSHFGVAARMALVSMAQADEQDPLDEYIEAQIHGPLRLADDVEALVLDPCYAGTEVEAQASALPCPLEWHRGFRLPVETLREHPTYRGPEYVELGAALARDGYLTPLIVGEAARTDRYEPQDLKKVWHYLARYGETHCRYALNGIAVGRTGRSLSVTSPRDLGGMLSPARAFDGSDAAHAISLWSWDPVESMRAARRFAHGLRRLAGRDRRRVRLPLASPRLAGAPLGPLAARRRTRWHLHGDRRWRAGRRLQPSLDPIVESEVSPISAHVGGLIGGLSHPLLDGIMHSDLKPFWPCSTANPFLDVVGLGVLHGACVVSGIAGAAVLAARVAGRRRLNNL